MDIKNIEKIESLLLVNGEKKLEDSIKDYFNNKTILITGAGGSIGFELSKSLSENTNSTLILIDNCEYNLFRLEFRLVKKDKIIVRFIDIRDEESLRYLFKEFDIDIVFHSAALKHVPIVERNHYEAIKTNIIGTYNLMKLAGENFVKKFIFISTDKAVKPISFMGKTKRVGEIMSAYFNGIYKTSFVAVRFGNVLGSSGSVIPIFKSQIDSGGPITLRHREATRFFMSLQEAIYLVLSAAALASRGELLILKMGDPIAIYDVAKAMLKLYKKEDIEIVTTGLEAGEKVHESLMTEEEELEAEENDFYFLCKVNNHRKIEELFELLQSDNYSFSKLEQIVENLSK